MPRENSIHKGLIVCTKEYGAFVQISASAWHGEASWFHMAVVVKTVLVISILVGTGR